MNAALLRRGSSQRIALLYGVLFIAAVVVVLLYIYMTTVGFMDRQLDGILEAEVRGLSQQYEAEDMPGLERAINERVAQHPDGEVVYLLTRDKQEVLAGNLPQWPAAPVDEDGWTNFPLMHWGLNNETRSARALTITLSDDLQLLVGRDLANRNHVHRVILDALLGALAITVVLALGIGAWVSRRVTRRLEVMNKTARSIMDGDLSQRVPRDDSNDDFDQVGANLNRMLDRIQALLTSMQEISSNVAHDLRKPLTRLRHRLEESQHADPEDIQASLQKATLEADALMSTFNALLRIARIESRSGHSEFVEVDAAKLLADVGELYEPSALENKQQLIVTAEPGLCVWADRDLLFQAVANLVDNAVKYTPAGGRIDILAETVGASILIAVSDSGPGIPTELREKVFQRFYRVEDSRTTPGNGLGLSLVQAIANLHNTSVTLLDNAPGLRVELRLEHAETAGRPGEV